MNVVFDHREDVAQNITTFYFKPERPVRYIAGQFIELQIPHNAPDSRGDKRWFTLSSTPSEPLIAITTALAGEHSSSFKRELNALQPGMTATISLPMGDFVLPKDTTIPLIFVAAGVGITPFRSILTDLHYRDQHRDITLLYAAHTPEELAYTDFFKDCLGEHFISLTTSEADNKLTSESIAALTQPTDRHYMYISGPEELVEVLTKELADSHIDRQRVFTDYFHGYIA